MVTAILAFAFMFCLLYGQIALPWLLALCTGLGAALAITNRHKHEGVMSIDVIAQGSRLKGMNPTLKFLTMLALMVASIAAGSVYAGLFLFAVMPALAVFAGGLGLRSYVRVIALPASFLMIAGLALLIEITPEHAGVLGVRIPGAWLSVTGAA